jgi:stress-induced morphogen
MSPNQIKDRLVTAFPGANIQVQDLTGTEDHYEVEIVSPLFKDRSRLERQRMVMDVFSHELKSGEVHALTIKTKEI